MSVDFLYPFFIKKLTGDQYITRILVQSDIRVSQESYGWTIGINVLWRYITPEDHTFGPPGRLILKIEKKPMQNVHLCQGFDRAKDTNTDFIHLN